jgi:alanine racemase
MSASASAFEVLRAKLPPAPASLANSGGTFLGHAYHFDLVRPGIALYGGRAHEGAPNPMQTVVRLAAKILQIREVARARRSATAHLQGAKALAHRHHRGWLRRRLPARLERGHRRGGSRRLHRRLSRADRRRVSMDFITADVTSVPPELARRGAWVEVMGHRVTVDDLTDRAGTIGYELLSRLGQRV